MKKENAQKPVEVKLDLKRIFLTAPNTRKEKILLLVFMVLAFMFFFGPLTFSETHPVKAILVSAIPAITTSWGVLVLTRFVGRKDEFCVQEDMAKARPIAQANREAKAAKKAAKATRGTHTSTNKFHKNNQNKK